MIRIDLAIQNPWHNDKKNPWIDIHQNEISISKNKLLDYGIDYHTWDLFRIEIDTRWRGQDHAGLEFDIRLFGLGFRIAIRDKRHWNHDANRWVNYDDPEEVEDW